jgi:hypothetical protein
MHDYTTPPGAASAMPFGKHKGQPLSDVPGDYLVWLLRECKLSSGLRVAVADELTRRGQRPPPVEVPPPPRCPDCKSASEPRYTWQQRRDGGRCIRGECAACQRFLAFVPLVEPYTGMADRAASMTPELDVLITCNELGIDLKSDGQAADFATPADRERAPQRLRDLLRQCSHSLVQPQSGHFRN